MARMSIGEVARRTGLETSAIRYYESIGLLPEPARDSGRRVYGDEILIQLALIHGAKQTGFTLREIHRLINGFSADIPPGERWRTLAANKVDQIERRIAELQQIRDRIDRTIACECRDLTECASALGSSCRQAREDPPETAPMAE